MLNNGVEGRYVQRSVVQNTDGIGGKVGRSSSMPPSGEGEIQEEGEGGGKGEGGGGWGQVM